MDSDVLQERLFRAILLPPGSVPRYAVKSDLEFYRSENLPKVAMFQDLASRFSPLCPTSNTFAVTTHGYACSVEELSAMTPYPEDFALSESERSELLFQKPFDHASSPNADLVVFSSYYRDLSSWLSQAPPLLLRPFHSSTTSPRATTRLGGYGIALDIKNTEYKVLDDRSSVGERLSARELKEETETETQGFLFSTLLRRYPSLSSSLEAFRESLASEQATAESIAPLALKDLGLKAAARVLRGKDPLRALREVSCDLPAVAAAVARVPVTERMRKEATKMRGRFEGMENTVLVNGKRVDFASTTLNVFELQKQLREDDAFLEELRKVNLTAADVRENRVDFGGGSGGDSAVAVVVGARGRFLLQRPVEGPSLPRVCAVVGAVSRAGDAAADGTSELFDADSGGGSAVGAGGDAAGLLRAAAAGISRAIGTGAVFARGSEGAAGGEGSW